MSAWTVKQPILWAIVALGLCCLFGAAYSINAWMQNERARKAADQTQSDIHVQRAEVNIGKKRAERNGVKDKPAEAIAWSERVPVYGQIVPNPRASTEVRLPFAGTLREVTEAPWPAPGEWVRAGRLLGRLEVRVGPQEKLDWQSKLSEARLKQQGAEEVLKIEQARLDRLKSLSAAVPQRELDDALVRFAEARTQLALAQAAVKFWQDALAESAKAGNGVTLWHQPLTAPADGEVTELLARPGMTVEAGAVVARLVDFRRPLARLDLPPDVLAARTPRQLTLSVMGRAPAAFRGVSNHPEVGNAAPAMAATLAGAAPQIDASSQLASFWYEGTPAADEKGNDLRLWRPGLFVKAEVVLPNQSQRSAVAVPASALLFHQGRALVYVRLEPGRYERREVQLLGRDRDRWVLASGIQAGEPVVYEQAQVLLSQEFNADTD